jgi:cysteine-rich repeat protein
MPAISRPAATGYASSARAATMAIPSRATAASELHTVGLRQRRARRDELCDDGNIVSGDGCDANCTSTAWATAFRPPARSATTGT